MIEWHDPSGYNGQRSIRSNSLSTSFHSFLATLDIACVTCLFLCFSLSEDVTNRKIEKGDALRIYSCCALWQYLYRWQTVWKWNERAWRNSASRSRIIQRKLLLASHVSRPRTKKSSRMITYREHTIDTKIFLIPERTHGGKTYRPDLHHVLILFSYGQMVHQRQRTWMSWRELTAHSGEQRCDCDETFSFESALLAVVAGALWRFFSDFRESRMVWTRDGRSTWFQRLCMSLSG